MLQHKIKTLFTACACALGLTLGATGAQAAFPERPITIVVPYAPGGASDAVAHVFATHMWSKLATSVIIDYNAGSSTTLYTLIISKAPSYS